MIPIFMLFCRYGAIAQLGERFAGSEEVGGSSPPGSTIKISTFLDTPKKAEEKPYINYYN